MKQSPQAITFTQRRRFMGAACVGAALLCLPSTAAGRVISAAPGPRLPGDLEFTGYRYSDGRRIRLMRSRSNNFMIYEFME